MKFSFKIKSRSKSGSVFVELALVVPFLIFLVLAIFEVSRMYHIQNTLEYGAKQAARIGASIKESVDVNFMGRGTILKSELENLIINSVRVRGIIEEREQFTIKYYNMAGNEVMGIQDLPFDRQNNPGSIDFIEVEIKYPGSGPSVSTPIPAVLDPGRVLELANIFPNGGVTLRAKAIFKIEGRFDE